MLIYGKDVPEMSAIEFGNELRENPNALVHFQAWTWDWWIIGANSKGENPIAYAHFKKEARDGRYWHWFITEGRKESDGDYRLFGLVNGFDKEIGYVMLSELASVGAVHDLKFGKIGIYDIYEDFDLRR